MPCNYHYFNNGSKTLPGHGVLLHMNGMGIYLIGDSGVGKSELALQLIEEKNAILVCDDGPQLTINLTTQQLLGSCPKGFFGLMHIHDLGLIDLIELYGPQVFKQKQKIDFVIELLVVDKQEQLIQQGNPQHLLSSHLKKWHYHSCSVAGISIHLYPERNISLLVKTAVQIFNHNNHKNKVNINDTTNC